MKTQDLIINNIKRGFNGCHLRSVSHVVKRLSIDYGCNIEVVESAENSLKLAFDVEDAFVVEFVLSTNPINGLQNWCTDIKIVE